jgi:hypothetical protein
MRLPTLSRREKFESASLLVAGLASVGVASPLLAIEGILSDAQFAVAFCFWLCGFIFDRRRRALPPPPRAQWALIGSIVLGYLSVSKIDSDGINANTTFLELAEEIAATHAESEENPNDASATRPHQGRSD